jgi:imidazolonepropionase-like amidohydrolase
MLAVRASKLFDGTGRAAVENATLLVDGQRIVAVGPSSQVAVPDDAEVVEASGSTLLPGLIDVHVHVHAPGGAIANYALAEARDVQGLIALRASAYVKRGLKMGYTTLRSLNSPAYVDVALRDAIDQGYVAGPRLKVAGQGLSITGGHMDQAHFSPDIAVSGRTGVCDGPWEGRKAVRTQCKRGVDVIKINACASGVGGYTVDPPWMEEMTFEEIDAICQEAHKFQRRVAAHVSGGQGITDAIRAGVDSLEHAHWLTDEQIGLMVEKGTFYVPTLIVNSRSVATRAEQGDLSSIAWDWLIKADEAKWDSLARAKAAGVKVATGSDAGFLVNHGESACEIVELVKGGFTPVEALIAATRTAAECLGMEQEIGTLEAGKLADFVLVDGDPLADVGVLMDESRIAHVYKGGQRFRKGEE